MTSNFKFCKLGICLTLLAVSAPACFAQDSEATKNTDSYQSIDEIIVRGTIAWEGHDGMDAFNAGDYETAEIEFEQEFKSLKRADSAKYNAAVAADIGFDRAQAVGQSTIGGTPNGPGGFTPPTPPTPDQGINGSFSNKRGTGQNVLNDGKVTNYDFAITKYMSGLSEIKLGKYEEAKSSLKTALHFDKQNYDARMRLGLLYLLNQDLDKAAIQLEKLDKQRLKCKKKNCDEYQEILDSASILATKINDTLNKQ